WTPFKKLVEEKKESVDRSEATGARELGEDPKTGKPVSVRLGRYGPYAAIGSTAEDAEDKPTFASLRPGQSMHTISLEDALELFKLPRKLGQDKDEEVSVGIGRFGAFAKRGSVYASLKKEDDPYTVDLARAVFLIEEKEEIARNRIIKEFEGSEIQVLNGRYGPYISDGKLNGRIPKDREPASLTLDDVVKLMEETGKPMRKGFGKKTAAKKATVKKEAAPKKAATKKTATKKTTKKATKKTATKKVAAKKAPARRTEAPVVEPAKSLLTPAANIELGKKRIVKAVK
ncbi:MAG: topoisomerase C-terminal repeat-containing protein, partial [Pseudoxanthomonas sp.]